MNNEVRMAFLYSGISYQHSLTAPGEPFEKIKAIPIESLDAKLLSEVDVLIVPRSTDMELLYFKRYIIQRWLDSGRVLVHFGEAWMNYLPGASWEPENHEDTLDPLIISENPLVKGFKPHDLYWHVSIDKWCCHGHLNAPKGAEVLVTNTAGGAWAYIDRVSSRGVILACSNLDADCHSSAPRGTPAARDFVSRALSWARDEALAMRNKKLPKKPIAFLYSGIHFQKNLVEDPEFKPFFDPYHIFEFPTVDLSSYKVLWVGRETNQEVLRRSQSKIVGFLNKGGTLVSFEEANTPWLPVGEWIPERADIDKIVLKTDHPLLQGFTADDFRWHCHGQLKPPAKATVLMHDDVGRVAMFLDESTYSGRILAMILDPECHTGFGSGTCRKFLSRIVEWACQPPLLQTA